jgi:hypothetical protein
VENKKPDSVESGLAVVERGGFQPRGASCARIHRRQAGPCQRMDLTSVVLTVVALMAVDVKLFIEPS